MTRVATHAGAGEKKAKGPKAGTKQQRAKLEWYPGLNPVEKELKSGKKVLRPTTRLDSIPADFDPKKHKPLGRGCFNDESVYLELKATQYEQKAKDFRQQAADMKALGGIKDKAQAKKLISLQKRMMDQIADLEKAGVDVSALKAKLGAQLNAVTAPPAAQEQLSNVQAAA